MVSPFEDEYKLTKLIKQGKAFIAKEFQPLAEWINKTYDVMTLNIMYDCIDHDVSRPRLSIIFEFESDKQKFYTDNGLNIDSTKQKEVAREFKILTQGIVTKPANKLLYIFSQEVPKYNADNLWVFFHVFEPYARAEANEQVTAHQIKHLLNVMVDDQIWTITKTFDTAVFFFYTDEQVKTHEKNGMRKIFSLRYLELVKPYDEFDYFKRDNFLVTLDSKENFDKNYKGNWYNYFA